MKKIISVIFIIMILISALTACGSNKLLGSWEITENDITVTLTFDKDGKGTISATGTETFDIEWYANSEKISAAATINGEINNFFNGSEYTVEDNKLTVITEDETFVLTRKE